VKSLLAHKYPSARLEEIEAEVYRFYLEAHDPERQITKKPARPNLVRHTRYIPVAVRRAVWQRDEGRCVHQYANGERCSSTYGVQIDPRYLFSQGGRSDRLDNLRLLCRVHNQLEAERELGKLTMDRIRMKKQTGPTFPKVERLGFQNIQ